ARRRGEDGAQEGNAKCGLLAQALQWSTSAASPTRSIPLSGASGLRAPVARRRADDRRPTLRGHSVSPPRLTLVLRTTGSHAFCGVEFAVRVPADRHRLVRRSFSATSTMACNQDGRI